MAVPRTRRPGVPTSPRGEEVKAAMLGRLSPLPLGTRIFSSEYQGCHARRRRCPPSFALLASGDTRKWVLIGPVSLRDGMEEMISGECEREEERERGRRRRAGTAVLSCLINLITWISNGGRGRSDLGYGGGHGRASHSPSWCPYLAAWRGGKSSHARSVVASASRDQDLQQRVPGLPRPPPPTARPRRRRCLQTAGSKSPRGWFCFASEMGWQNKTTPWRGTSCEEFSACMY